MRQKIRMLVNISGTRDGQQWPPIGGTINLPEAEAEQYVALGYADTVETSKTEKATAAPGEKRARSKPKTENR
jgi:hypothetical protein